jgi:hypothetical protein
MSPTLHMTAVEFSTKCTSLRRLTDGIAARRAETALGRPPDYQVCG